MPTEGYDTLLDILRSRVTEIQEEKDLRKNLMDDLIDAEHRYDLVWALGNKPLLFNNEQTRNDLKDVVDSLIRGIVIHDSEPENPRAGDIFMNNDDDVLVVFDGGDWRRLAE